MQLEIQELISLSSQPTLLRPILIGFGNWSFLMARYIVLRLSPVLNLTSVNRNIRSDAARFRLMLMFVLSHLISVKDKLGGFIRFYQMVRLKITRVG